MTSISKKRRNTKPKVKQSVDVVLQEEVFEEAEAEQDISPTMSAPAAPASVSKAESIGASAKIEQATRRDADLKKKQIDQAEKQIKQAEIEIKNTEALKKVMEGLLKTIKDGESQPAPTSPDAPTNNPLAAAPEQKKGLLATMRGAMGGAIKQKLEPVRNLTTAKGLTGLVAASYGGNPNSIIGGIASALHERELLKQDERDKKENFHTGYLTGTDAGRDLAKKKSAEAEEQLKKDKPKLDINSKKFKKELAKRTDALTRGATDGIYKEKIDTEEKITKLNETETSLKTKDKLFGLSKTDTDERDRLLAERAKLVTGVGVEKENASKIVAKETTEEGVEAGKFDEKRQKKINELEGYHGRKLTDKEVASIDAAIEQSAKKTIAKLEEVRQAIKGEGPSAQDSMEAVNSDSAADINAKKHKDAPDGAKKGFLDKSKGVLAKGKDSLLDGLGSIMEKVMGSSIGKIGATLMGAIAPLMTALGPVLAVVGAGAAGYLAAKALGADKAGAAIGGAAADATLYDANKQSDLDNAKKILSDHPDMKLNGAQVRLLKKSGIEVPADRIQVQQSAPVVAPQPAMEKAPRDVKPTIDEKSAEVEKAKSDKPIVVSSPTVSAPIINNSSSTTTIVRPPIRNQEPSFSRVLQKNFL